MRKLKTGINTKLSMTIANEQKLEVLKRLYSELGIEFNESLASLKKENKELRTELDAFQNEYWKTFPLDSRYEISTFGSIRYKPWNKIHYIQLSTRPIRFFNSEETGISFKMSMRKVMAITFCGFEPDDNVRTTIINKSNGLRLNNMIFKSASKMRNNWRDFTDEKFKRISINH